MTLFSANPTMGVKTFSHEHAVKVSPSRLFKALVTESHEVLAKITSLVKSIETVEGDGVTVGCVRQSNFPEGAQLKYVKHRIDAIDTENNTCKYTLIEGDMLGDKLEKICYDIKFEDSEDGGCTIKLTSEYHTKGDYEIGDEENKAGEELATALYNACEEYLAANPDVCA